MFCPGTYHSSGIFGQRPEYALVLLLHNTHFFSLRYSFLTTHPSFTAGRKYAHYGWQRVALSGCEILTSCSLTVEPWLHD